MSDIGHVLIDIDLLIARIEAIGTIKVQPIIAHALLEHVTATISESTDAYGHAWRPTKAGNPPLANAAKQLHVYTSKTVAGIKTAREIEGRHHLGRAKGGVQRKIIPIRHIPGRLATLIKVRLHEAFIRASK